MSNVKNSCLPALLFSTPTSPATVKMDYMIIFNFLKIWWQIRKDCRLPDASIYAPVYRNHALSPSLSDGSFNSCRLKRLVTLKDLYINKQFVTFAKLKSFFFSHNTFFWYLQIKNYVHQFVPNFESLPKDKMIYKLLWAYSLNNQIMLHTLWKNPGRRSWEWDDVWKEGLGRTCSRSINTRQLLQFKVMHRLHYSKNKLHRIFPTISSLCDRCKSADGLWLTSFGLVQNYIIFGVTFLSGFLTCTAVCLNLTQWLHYLGFLLLYLNIEFWCKAQLCMEW